MKSLDARGVKRRLESHPTRGAWIEINTYTLELTVVEVAPHTGCVD